MSSSLKEILKNKIKEYSNQHDYKNAAFYAEKLLTTCESNYLKKFFFFFFLTFFQDSIEEEFIDSLHLLVNSYFQFGEYKRVFHLLTKTYSKITNVDSKTFFLAAKCLV